MAAIAVDLFYSNRWRTRNIPTFTLLIVEDVGTDREQYRRMLSKDASCTYHLLEAASVAGGLTLCRTQSIDAILLDYGLPDGDGLGFLAALDAQSNSGSRPPVVMVTGMGSQEIAVKAMKLGAEDYLVKHDLTPERLQSTLRSAIENARLRRQLQQANGGDITKQKRDEELLQAQQVTIQQELSTIEVCTQRKGQHIARIASFTVILVGCAVLIGWRLELESLKSLIPGLASMKVNTALCFIGAGIALRLLAHRSRNSRQARIVNGLAIAITITAFLTICQYVLGWNLGIDELIFSDPRSPATSHPGRMGVNTAVNFGLTGAALWLLNRQDRQPPRSQQRVRVDTIALAQSLALVVGAIALQALVGYVYNVKVFYYLATLTTSMALHTAVGFVVLAVGMLAFRSDRGWMRSLTTDRMGGDIARRFIPAAIVLPMALGWLILTGLNANLYDQNFAFSLMSMSLTAISLGLIAKNTDIINRIDYDRIRSNDRMRSSQERLKLALEGAKQGTWDFDLQTQELVWDDRCKELFGLSPAAVVNYDRYLAGVYSEDRQHVADAVAMAIRDCAEFTQEHRTVHSDGTNWILTQGRCWGDPARKRYRMSGTMMDITDRKQAEIALKIGEELFRSTFENTSVGMAHVAIDGPWIRVNHKLCEILGYSRAELLATTYQAITVPADADQDVAVVQRLLNGEINECTLEKRYIHKQGHYVWANLTVTLIRTIATDGQLGIPQYFIAVIENITDRKQLEAQLRQRESQLQLFVKYVPAGVAMFDRDMRYLVASDVWLDCHELRDRDILGRSHYDLYPNLPQRWQEIHQRCLAGAIESCEEDRFPRPDGLLDWVRWEIRPWYTDSDEVGGIIMFSEVITERKRQSAALLQSERKFSAIFNQTFQLMGLVSLDGLLLDVNQAALDSIATPESKIIGKSFWDAPWWHTEQLQKQLRDAIATAASGRFVRYEVEFLNPNGGVTITDFSLKPMFDEVGQVESIVAEAHDITDRKQAQAALEQRNQELDSFVHIVSHDLKAPLRAVANLSEWIEEDLEGSLSVANQQQMALLRRRVYKMEATINGLLDYARIGTTVETVESVSIAELLADVIDSIAPPPTFTIELPPELPTLSTQRLPLFQIFANLIGNGIKHHHSEAGLMQIAIVDRGDCYEFSVADDGPGIAPEHHDQIFTIFQAVNPQNRSDSTGIGLAIVKKMIEAQGGRIWLDKNVKQGARFCFTWMKTEV